MKNWKILKTEQIFHQKAPDSILKKIKQGTYHKTFFAV